MSPGVLGIGWLPAVLATGTFERTKPRTLSLGIRGRGMAVLLVGTLVICGVLSICLVSDGGLVLGGVLLGSPAAWFLGVEAIPGVALACALLAAFAFARAVGRHGLGRWAAIPLRVTGFAIAGAVWSFAVSSLRPILGGTAPFALVLATMHAGGFVLAYVAGLIPLSALRNQLPGVSPVLTA